MNNRHCIFALYLMTVSQVIPFASSDTLVAGSTRYEGVFMGYKNNNFTFMLEDGKTMTKNRTMLKALELTRPATVSYLERGKKKVDNAEFHGYEKFKFVFVNEGRKVHINGSSLREIELPKIREEGGSDMFHVDIKEVIPPIRFTGLEGADLSAEQQTVISAYKEARAEYEQYISDTTELSKQLESMKGMKREQILNRLRARKQDEAPVKEALRASTENLLAVFPPADKNNRSD